MSNTTRIPDRWSGRIKLVTLKKRNKAILQLLDSIHKDAKEKVVYTNKDCNSTKKFSRLSKLFRDLLKQQGFKMLDSGGYKIVYKHPDYSEFVVKVYKDDYGHGEDTNVSKLPKYLRRHLLEPILKKQLYLVQPSVNNESGKWKENPPEWALFELLGNDSRAEFAQELDIRAGNIRYHNGHPVIIDFCGV